MSTLKEHEYTTYPRKFTAYKWYKPVLVGLLTLVFMLLFFAFILYAQRKLHWFDKVKYDDAEKFNAKHK